MIRIDNFQFKLKPALYNMLCFLMLLLTTGVNLEVQTVKYQAEILRKTGSNYPVETGFVYQKFNNQPARITTFGNGIARRSIETSEPAQHEKSTFLQYPTSVSDFKYKDNIVFASVADKYSDVPIKNRGGKRNALDEPFDINPKKIFLTRNSPDKEPYEMVSKDKYVDNTSLLPIANYPSYTTPNVSPAIPRFHIYNPLEPEISKMEIDNEISKSKSNYDSTSYPSRIKSDIMYEQLKSIMHYRLPAEVNSNYGPISINNFNMDEGDIRTSSGSSYDDWPFFYHPPYEYEHMKISSDIQKAKDKRFAADSNDKYIPVHEHHEYDTPILNSPHTHILTTTTTDNPISGDKPFISVVLGDYFNSRTDEDPLTFKGLYLDNGNDFYYDNVQTGYEASKRNRRLPSVEKNTYPPIYGSITSGNSVTERGHIKQDDYDHMEKGDMYNENDGTSHEQKHDSRRGFKQFVDSFANKFGSDDKLKQSHYKLSMGQDKGEKRKGFHKVYHKDEYQEDKEFYDNSNVKAQGDEKLNSFMHKGGSEAFLQSLANAAQINDANTYNRQGSTQRNKYKNMKSGHNQISGSNKDFNKFRDVARNTALSNKDYDYNSNV